VKLFMLLGHPVESSPSPAMHNAAFSHMGLDHLYMAVDVPPPNLQDAVGGIRALGIAGANITIPHKISVIPLLDELDKTAKLVGAVNTVKNSGGKLIGYNTDGAGALKAIESVVPINGKKTLLLGAGGAARAIAFSLAEANAELTIANRTIARAKALAKDIQEKVNKTVKCVGLSRKELSAAAKESEILINATSVGMYPKSGATILNSEMIPRGAVVFDAVYKPLETKLLKEARKAGARVIRGIEMLVHQGALSFEIWTGEKAPIKIMRKAAEGELRRLK